jgi:5-formyltetrahydrofolate cyclo-ligase
MDRSRNGSPARLEKGELRQEFCDLRECMLPDDLEASSDAVCARLAAFPPLREAHTAMGYLAFRSEIDLKALFGVLSGIRWVMPRVAGHRMIVHTYDPDRLVRHRFGMMEPDPCLPVVEPDEIDVVLVPGVAYDRRGGRLGFGGGYYDRFLPTTPALRVGIAHSSCLAEEIPCGPLDQRMDWVATPAELIHCAPLWRKTSPALPVAD